MRKNRKFVNLIEKFFPHRSKLAKFTKIPILNWITKKMVFEKTNLTILPKDTIVEISLNKNIPPPESIVLPSKIVEHFIKKSSYQFIMDFCICRESMDCTNYPKNLGCLFLGEAAKHINNEFGYEATKAEALKHVEKCRKLGLVHLVGRDVIDEQWLGVSPGEKLMVICNCCNCCCLWRILPDMDKDLGLVVKKMPGVQIVVTDECTGCKKCKDICFVKAIKMEDGVAKISNECRGCGRCAEICPNDAIELKINNKDFIEKTIKRINSSVDVS